MDFWYHRSQRHSGQRPRRCKCFYEYRFACAVFWTMDFFIYIFFLTGWVTWGLRSSSFSVKANIWTSKRFKWEGYWTLASVHTGWKTTWCGSVCGQLDNFKDALKKKLNFVPLPHPCISMKEELILIRKHQPESYPFMIRSHLGWDILSSSNVAQQFSSSSDTWGFIALMSSTSKYSGCWRCFMMGESSSL